MLVIENLNVFYGMIHALKDVSFDLSAPGIYAIIGANGAGKSTLLKTIMGVVKPKTGSIKFYGKELVGKKAFEVVREGVVLCPEGRGIFKNVTVLDNLKAGAITADKSHLQMNIDKSFDLFPRLKERATQIAGTLSGGELQMLAIARSLMAEPRLLLLDEPSMGLAPNLVDLVFNTIEFIFNERRIPVIVVEQNAEASLEIAHKALVLEVGSVTLSGDSQDLLNSDEVRKKYLGV
ncbi:ABC transporter ATP-binding protein [Pyramidobacter sp. SM-530-WT-4B]|uniref:ABC transporter ATP-binding protein n=1 Tax=Pyramidobacter porci TaxID=2605789 RepID=A0A6L5YB56_9BACT|nr:ABC transporter ATP-binding protein [Pyramidobacter porci]MST54782.1 ABC transporter ATP-binding protein [Pyramidobacter porci]